MPAAIDDDDVDCGARSCESDGVKAATKVVEGTLDDRAGDAASVGLATYHLVTAGLDGLIGCG